MSAPTVLEYARFHGLATDHTSEHLIEYISPAPLRVIEDDQQLSDPDFSTFASEFVEPKLQLSHQGGILLAESVLDRHPTINWSHFLPEQHRVKKLKIEEPQLARDHETDVRRFRREASSHVDTEHFFETCSLISSASGEDFEDEWDDIQSGQALREVEQELEDERCHTTKEALLHLSDSLKGTLSEEMKATILDSFVPMVKISRAKSLTPMLMPESPELHIPSLPNPDLSLRPDEAVDLDNLLLELEKEMQEKDQLLSDEIGDVNPTTAKQALERIQNAIHLEIEEDLRMETVCASFTERNRVRRDIKNMRLDVPTISSSSQSEQLSEQAATLLPSVEHASRAQFPARAAPDHPSVGCTDYSRKLGSFDDLLSSTTVKSANYGVGTTQEDDIVEELIKLASRAVNETDARLRCDKISIHQESLKQPVPSLEPFSVRYLCDSQEAESLMNKLDETCFLVTPQTGTLEDEMKLNWSPFPPRFIRLILGDGIEDDCKVRRFADPPHGIIKSDKMLWKRPGLRILDTDDDGDSEMEEDLELHESMSKVAEPVVPAKRLKHGSKSTCKSQAKKSCLLHANGTQNLLAYKNSHTANCFSTSDALETFLDLRGGKFKRVAPPQAPSSNELADDPIQPTQSEEDIHINLARGSVLKPSEALAELNSSAIQVPSTPTETAHIGDNEDLYPLVESKWPRTILIETATLARYRSLISFLETNGGKQLNLIYRDLNKSDRNAPPSTSPDMILNPRTALIFTNLQALSQKSLPGHGIEAGQGMVQSRILRLGNDYSQLFILVATLGIESILLQPQIDTMTTFAGFCASVSNCNGLHVHPIWVSWRPGAQSVETALSRWTWNLACRHGFPEINPSESLRPKMDTVTFINEETLWEQFLRKAGLNPMAAQVVLGALRRVDTSEIRVDQNWGLRKFVEMHPDERKDMFAEILGWRVVERINTILDEDWGLEMGRKAVVDARC